MLDLTPLLKLSARRRAKQLARMEPAAVQRAQLAHLLAEAGTTRFGRDHDFRAIRATEDFRRAVPLRTYDEMWRDYWSATFPVLDDVSWPGCVRYFAATPGTTGDVTK